MEIYMIAKFDGENTINLSVNFKFLNYLLNSCLFNEFLFWPSALYFFASIFYHKDIMG